MIAGMPEFAEDPSNGPHDDLHYREYKILLHPERFTTPQAFQDFWQVVKRVAKQFEVKLEESEDAFANQVREVLFAEQVKWQVHPGVEATRQTPFCYIVF